MPITLTCPSCGQQCAVKEEYAGQQVRCPRCPAVLSVPPAGAAEAMVETAPAGGATSLPLPRASAGPAFVTNMTKFLAANGIAGLNVILLLVGLGCMAFLVTVLLPWLQFFNASALGITIGVGILDFFLVLGALFLFVFVTLLGWSKLFDYALWTASNLSIFITLHLLTLFSAAAWGLYISFIVMLTASATLGIVVFSKLFSKSGSTM